MTSTPSAALARLADGVGRLARDRFPAGSPLGDRLRGLRGRLPRRPPEQPLGQLIFAYAERNPEAFVVQIGANDGMALDPLRQELIHRRWRGILVEPVPYVFERLQANHGRNPRLILENAAIADVDGTRDLWHLPRTDDGSVWRWYHALGSFRREVVLKHADVIPDIEQRLIATPVPCLTFESLCRKHGVTRVDVVQSDTEGYDLEILRMIDLKRWHPSLVMFEQCHLDEAERAESAALLGRYGYRHVSDDMDTLGIHQSVLDGDPGLAGLVDRLTAASGAQA